MMTQSIPTKASGILLQAAGSANIAKRSGKRDFEIFFDDSIRRETKITVSAKTINESTNNNPDNYKAQATDGKEKITDINRDNKAINSDVANTDTQKVDKMTEEEKNPKELINKDLLEQILTMLEQIRNLVMKDLDLTPEEFDSMMENLGLEISDLADPQAISRLVLADAQTTDPLALLLDEQLGDTFQGLLTKVEDIKCKANLKLSDDEIKQIIEQISKIESEDSEAIIGENEAETLQPQVLSKSEEDKDKAKDNTVRAESTPEDNNIDKQRPAVASKGDSELQDANDRRSEADETDGFEAFLDKLSANYSKPAVDIGNEGVRLYEIREIAQQIIEQIRVIINPEQTTMELQLNPDYLGKVNLTISSKEGVMTAHFKVQNDLAKEAIEGQLITLKDTLAQQGIKVETIDVTVAGYTFDQNSPSDNAEQKMHKKQSGNKLTFEEAVAKSEEPVEVSDSTKLTGTMGYNIDYTA